MAVKKTKKAEVIGFVNVIKSGYHIRKEPNTKSDSLLKTSDGDVLLLLNERKNGWCKVKIGDIVGYLSERAGILKESEQTTMYIKLVRDKVPVKESPYGKCKKICDICKTDLVFDLHEEESGYRKVMVGSAAIGWITTKAITLK